MPQRQRSQQNNMSNTKSGRGAAALDRRLTFASWGRAGETGRRRCIENYPPESLGQGRYVTTLQKAKQTRPAAFHSAVIRSQCSITRYETIYEIYYYYRQKMVLSVVHLKECIHSSIPQIVSDSAVNTNTQTKYNKPCSYSF